MESTEISIIMGALVGGIVTIIGLFFKQMNRSDAIHSEAQKVLVEALKNNTEASKEVADATCRSAEEAKIRNGHLAELTLGNRESNTKQTDKIVKSNTKILKTLQESAKIRKIEAKHSGLKVHGEQ